MQEAPSPSWRTFVAAFLQHWPRLMLLMAAGTILGYLAAPYLPLYHRAEVPMKVVLTNTTPLPPELLYIQAERVRDALEHPRLLEEVLQRLPPELRIRYSSPQHLARSLTVDWRITDQWYLVAYARGAGQARTLAEVWAQVVQEHLPQWEEVAQTYQEWRLTERLALWERMQLGRRLAGARRAQAFFASWLKEQTSLPAEEPLSPAERQIVLFWAAFAQMPSDVEILSMAPDPGSPRRDYIRWIEIWIQPRLPQVVAWLEAAQEENTEYLLTYARQQQKQLEREAITLWTPLHMTIEGPVQVYGVPAPTAGALLGLAGGLTLGLVFILAQSTLAPRRPT